MAKVININLMMFNIYYQWFFFFVFLTNFVKSCYITVTSVLQTPQKKSWFCQGSIVMTLFPELFTHSHTFKLWQWTKLSPGLLRVTGELTFGLQKQTSTWQISVWASSRLPPLWPLGTPSLPLPSPALIPKPTPCFFFVSKLSSSKLKTT